MTRKFWLEYVLLPSLQLGATWLRSKDEEHLEPEDKLALALENAAFKVMDYLTASTKDPDWTEIG